MNTQALQGIRSGNPAAFGIVVDKYFLRIARAAEKRINESKRRVSDGEDIAASVFESLWKRSERGLFQEPDLNDADQLWNYLCRLMRSKVTDHMRREQAAKRGGGDVRGESVFLVRGAEEGYLEVPAPGCFSPDELAEFFEQQQRLLGALDDDRLREIATLRLEGHEIAEIAQTVQLSDRSVKRKLSVIRDVWQKILASQDR